MKAFSKRGHLFVFPRQLIFWTTALIVAIGGIEALIFIQPPAQEKEIYHSASYRRAQRTKTPETNAQNRAILKDQSSGERAPASKEEKADFSAIPLDDRNSQQAVDLTLSCNGQQSSHFAKGVSQVRVNGTSCGSAVKREFIASEIYNETNGTSATVFFPTHTTFITDYINLVPGPNKIHIIHTFRKAPPETRDYVITRETVTKKI